MDINDITYKINGAIFEVNKILGPGFLEKVYENALLFELKSHCLTADKQVPIKVTYKDNSVGEYFADILVENQVIIELKTVEKLTNNHEAQLLNYLKATGLEKRQCDNALSNAWRAGKIDRHKDNGGADTGWGFARYALKLKDSERRVYVSTLATGRVSTKRRGAKATPKEIRMAFMQVQNSLAKLEDMIMPVVEEAEEKDKVLNKLKSML